MSYKNTHIAPLIDVLDVTLSDAKAVTTAAREAIHFGRVNEAIGAILPLGKDLENALALYRVALSLHQLSGEHGEGGPR